MNIGVNYAPEMSMTASCDGVKVFVNLAWMFFSPSEAFGGGEGGAVEYASRCAPYASWRALATPGTSQRQRESMTVGNLVKEALPLVSGISAYSLSIRASARRPDQPSHAQIIQPHTATVCTPKSQYGLSFTPVSRLAFPLKGINELRAPGRSKARCSQPPSRSTMVKANQLWYSTSGVCEQH